MQSESKPVSSGKNELSSRSEPSERLARPSRGRGRGRGKKLVSDSGEGSDVRVGHRQYEKPVASSHQKDANGKQRKQDTDKTSRKSRKPDQALYVPRSLRNQGNKPTTVSKTTEKATEHANEIERQSKRSQKDQHEPPHKRQIVDNESQMITTDHMASVTVQSGEDKHVENLDVAVLEKEHANEIERQSKRSQKDQHEPPHKRQIVDNESQMITTDHVASVMVHSGEDKHVESLDVAVLDKDHKDLTDSINDATSDDALDRLDPSDHDQEPKDNDHEIHKSDLTTQAFSFNTASADVQTTEGPQSNLPSAVEFESQEVCNVDLPENVTNSSEESYFNAQSINDDATKNTDTLECEKPSSDVDQGETMTASESNVDDINNLSKSVDQTIEPSHQQNDHRAINVETQLCVEENANDILEKDNGEPDDGNELIEESMDIQNEDNVNKVDIANTEPSIGKCNTEKIAAENVTTGAGDDEEEDDWEALFDDSGEALTSDAMEEISDAIGKVKVSVKKSKQDYYNYQPKDNFDYGRFNHVIEIFDFPVEFRTEDLIQSFSAYSIKGFDIKWVDDTHALGVFQSVSSAQNALGLQNPMLRTRPLTQATRESKLKARTFVDFLQPARPRPETSAVAARRLVSGALGIRSRESKEQKAAEMKKLKDAKEKRRVDKRLTEDVWEGNTWRL